VVIENQKMSNKPSLNRIIGQINKEHGETVIARLGDMKNVECERIKTGVESFDDAIGGGFPKGRLVELYGEPSSGKTLMSLLAIATAQKEGMGDCVFIDAENSFDPVWARKLGVNTDDLVLVQLGIGESIFDLISNVLRAEPAIIVVDSVGGMTTNTEYEATFDKQHMATKARLMSRALPIIVTKNKNTLIIFVNQIRTIVTTWGGGGSTTTGGRALGFYASIRVQVKKDREMLFEGPKTGHDPIGQVCQFRITKNKTAPPYVTGSFKLFFDGRVEGKKKKRKVVKTK